MAQLAEGALQINRIVLENLIEVFLKALRVKLTNGSKSFSFFGKSSVMANCNSSGACLIPFVS
jgi:hypothetical protein